MKRISILSLFIMLVVNTGNGQKYAIAIHGGAGIMVEDNFSEVKKMACQEEIQKLSELKGTGGVIGIDSNGNIAMEFNTRGMFRGDIKSNGDKEIAIFKTKSHN